MDAPAVKAVVALGAVVAVALVLCVRYDWWPLRRNLENIDKLLLLALAALIFFVVGVFWLIRTGLYAARRRGFAWLIAALPAIVVVGAVAAFIPGPDTFNDKRAGFDRVAQQTLADPDKLVENVEIGSFDVTAIQRRDGGVYVYDADSPGDVVAGWVYSPQTRPRYYEFSRLRSVGGGWYEFRVNL